MNAFVVLGAGSWGTALAVQLARNGVPTTLWGRTPQAVVDMATTRRNARYLPDLEIPDALQLSGALEPCVRDAGTLLLAVPSHAFDDLLAAIAPWVAPGIGIAWATKGFDPASGRFLHELVAARLPGHPAAVVTGPSFAREVAIGLPTALTVHSADATFARDVARALHSPRFRAYTGSDVLGAELGGAMKNVLAVATGVADGMQMGLNARAGLITRGLAEMLRLGAALGSRAETLMGLAGLGDLVLTCTGDLSRNRRLGLALGRGTPLAQAIAGIGQVVESVQTVDTVMKLADAHGVELPISALVQKVLHEELTPTEGMRALLAREQKPEYP
ncbi:NAD(P)H-dependent glycerol-3-phosphate dehydrogenase [Dokdonella fugitiva]|jgi:glycerol-3-phosphate dehydrogenase (NAD(P)+)|uniref:Glycerol-3-phosphate dehydrogenase [NAD(P)+] n=1 Tax=Dokdonella fugitiva TaxID=328517 RepID=A0A4V2S358_9GAMM|nr:NAD(P)H-dependent glycerol-3-phosphate dehydrogenase [Dokdonella fugitiva]TCO43110.1 glycerol-3-phosphate dehydrogenase (NAD(P)+) [Dokdonella fugitiva]